MKKFLSIFMMVVLCMFLVGCVQTSDNQDVSSDTSTSAQTEAEGTQDSLQLIRRRKAQSQMETAMF